MIDETVKALLIYSKKKDSNFNWYSIAKECLRDLYSSNMRLPDVIYVVHKAYITLCKEPRFQSSYDFDTLVLAPIESHRTNIMGYNLDDMLSVEDFYNKILACMMYGFMFSNIGWCREELYGADT